MRGIRAKLGKAQLADESIKMKYSIQIFLLLLGIGKRVDYGTPENRSEFDGNCWDEDRIITYRIYKINFVDNNLTKNG